MFDQSTSANRHQPVIFELGFRPFFLGATLFALLSIFIWIPGYFGWIPLNWTSISSFQWHGHQMIFGYCVAVIAGFLLTAVNNWTGIRTVHGLNLALLFGVWVLARITFLLGEEWIVAAAGLDMIFSVALVTAVTYPVVKSRQWKQMAIVSKLLIIIGFNACFYLGIFGLLENGVSLGVFGGFYMVIGLVLTLGRRVIPFFIERGVGYQVQLINSKWLDISSLVLYLGFFLAEVLFNYSRVAAVLALGLLAVNAIRLVGWHTRGIWKNPMLWILYLSMWFICLGFLFFGLSALVGMSKYIAVHAFAFGGIGLVTMGMMVRVSLGHTGRSVTQTPTMVKVAFGAILLGAVVRVLFPLIDIDRYSLWLVASQILWIAAFAFFLWSFLPILLNPRIDED